MESMRIVPWKYYWSLPLFSIVSLLAFSVTLMPACGEEFSPQSPEDVSRSARTAVLVRRVGLLPPVSFPPSGSGLIERVLERERGRIGRKRPKKKPTPKPTKKTAVVTPGAGQGNLPAKSDNINEAQLRQLGETLLTDALGERLREKLGVAVVPEAEMRAALVAVGLSPADAMTGEGAKRLCAYLGCDALLEARLRNVSIQEARTRQVTLRAEIYVPYLHLPSQEATGKTSLGRNASPDTIAPANSPPSRPRRIGRGAAAGGLFIPIRQFAVSGADSIGRLFFRAEFARSKPDMILMAAKQAAAQAVHTLQTGEIAPFMRDSERLAFFPVGAPTRADKLLFTAQGRRLLSEAVPDLAPDVSAGFAPDLLPLSPNALISPEEVRKTLELPSDRLIALWKPDGRPEVARIQDLGRFLRVDYVLLARVAEVQIEEGPSAQQLESSTPLSPDAPLEREARADAIGALVRVADGTLLWNERASATMTVRPGDITSLKRNLTDKQIAQDAVRFALIQLQRRFRAYRARYER